MRTHVRDLGGWAPIEIAILLGLSASSSTVGAADSEAQPPRGPEQQSERDAGARELRAGEAIGGGGRRGTPGPEELKRQLERAMDELNDLRAAGKEQEALQKKRQVMELQEQLERLQRGADRPLRSERLERGDAGPRPPADAPEMERRLQHLQVAIENLHAAGMHEPAERLTQQAEIMRRNLEARLPGPRPPGVPGPELHQLRAEVQELRKAVRELRARLDELARERGGP